MTTPTILARLATGQVISGVENCHLPNVDSIVIRERVDSRNGMVRVFFAREGHPLWGMFSPAGDFACMPHDHRQAIDLVPLFGDVWNHRFAVHAPTSGTCAFPVRRYAYESPLLSQSGGLKQTDAVYKLGYLQEQRLTGRLGLDAENVHTMTVHSVSAAWAVVEGAERSSGTPYCYSLVSGKKIDTTGLYLPMSHSVLAERCAMLLRCIAGGAK